MNTYRLIQGDCIFATNALDDKTLNLLILDPPYSSGARRDAEKTFSGSMIRSDKFEWFTHDFMTTKGYEWFLRQLLFAMKPKLIKGAHLYIFTDWRQYPSTSIVLESVGYKVINLIIWNKGHFGMGSYYRNQHELIVFASNGKARPLTSKSSANVITASNVHIDKRLHPTEKPVRVIRYLIKNATDKGDMVFDPMCGSGTTMKASQDLNRSSTCIELSPSYCEIVKKRCFGRTFLDREVEYSFEVMAP